VDKQKFRDLAKAKTDRDKAITALKRRLLNLSPKSKSPAAFRLKRSKTKVL
jgi:hypothetical protein